MATCKCGPVVKKSARKKMAASGAKAVGSEVIIQDNEDGTATVFGVDTAGAQVDISGVAALTASSDNTSALTVDAPVGMTFALHGVLPGSANIALTATWTDGSVGPFSINLPATVSTGPVTGLVIDLGQPVVRP